VPRQGQDARCVPPDVTAGDHWSRSNLGEEFMVPALNESVTCFNHFICCLFSVWISVHVLCMNLCKDVECCCSLPLAHCHWLSRDCYTACMKKIDTFVTKSMSSRIAWTTFFDWMSGDAAAWCRVLGLPFLPAFSIHGLQIKKTSVKVVSSIFDKASIHRG
jgi:hypothetical protein